MELLPWKWADNPDNIFEAGKREVGQVAGAVADTTVGRAVLGAVGNVAKAADPLFIPYREWVSPALTGVLLALNSDFQKQTPNLNFAERYRRGAELSKQQVPGEEEWRRAISPGRALYGLFGNLLGDDSNDDIDWANAKDVNDYFSRGKAQFWSGAADFGFNFLDPTSYVGGKVIKGAKSSLISRPLQGPVLKGLGDRTPKLVEEIRAAAENPQATRGGAAQIFKQIEKSISPETGRVEDLNNLENISIVRWSSNSTKMAIAIQSAANADITDAVKWRGNVADVISAALGDTTAYDRIAEKSKTLQALLDANSAAHLELEQELNKTTKRRVKKGTTTAQNRIDAEQLSLQRVEAKRALDTEKAVKTQSLKEFETVEEMRTAVENALESHTFSPFGIIERARYAASKINNEGLYIDIDPANNSFLDRAGRKLRNAATAPVRGAMWLSPKGRLREYESGVAYLGGSAGDRSFISETIARVRTYGTTANASKAEQKSLVNQARSLRTDADRHLFLENLEAKNITGILFRVAAKEKREISQAEADALSMFGRQLARVNNEHKYKLMQNLVDNNFTMVDAASGSDIVFDSLNKHVEHIAERLAEADGAKVNAAYRNKAKEMMKENPLTSTQTPNIHYGMDMRHVEKVLTENPSIIRHSVREILTGKYSEEQVRKLVKEAADSHIDDIHGLAGLVSKGAPAIGRAGRRMAIESLDNFYSYVWKPATLLSLKYTTRNIGDNSLRYIASMMDFNAMYGMSMTSMLKANARSYLDPKNIKNTAGKISYSRFVRKQERKMQEYTSEIVRVDQGLRTGMGAGTKPFKDAVRSEKFNLESEVVQKQLQNTDSITAITYFLRSTADALVNGRMKSITPKASQKREIALVEELKSAMNDTLFNPQKWHKGPSANFLSAIVAGDYDTAMRFINQMEPAEVLVALDDFIKQIGKSKEKISSIAARGTSGITTLDHYVRVADTLLPLLEETIGKTMSYVHMRAELQGKAQKISQIMYSKAKPDKIGEADVALFKAGDREIAIPGAFAGVAGDMLRMSTSSTATTTRVLADDRRSAAAAIMAAGRERTKVTGIEPSWPEAHADYVNNVLMRDTVANRIVRLVAGEDGKKPMDIATAVADTRAWLDARSPEARRWLQETAPLLDSRSKVGARGFKYQLDDQLKEIALQIEQYLPTAGALGDAYPDLHAAAVRGLTPDDSVKIKLADRWDVSADKALSTARLGNWYANAVAGIFKVVGTMPEDHLSRHPFFIMVHDATAQRMVNRVVRDAKRRNPKITKDELADLIESKKDSIKQVSTDRAYNELMERLYSVERYTSPGKFIRFMSPFYMAMQNSMRFWLGATVKDPTLAYNLAKVYNAPYRAGFVYDEEGNQVGRGNPWDGNSMKDSIVIGAPEWLRKRTGRDTLRTSPTSIDLITQGNPGFPSLGGPVGETFGREVAKMAIKNTNLDTFLQKHLNMSTNDFITKYVMPYYERDYGKSVIGSAVASLVPLNSSNTSFTAALYATVGNVPVLGDLPLANIPGVRERWDSRYKSALDQVTADFILKGTNLDPNVIEAKAKEIARNSLVLEGLSSFTGPVVAFKTDDKQLRDLRIEMKRYQDGFGYNDGSNRFILKLSERGVATPAGLVRILNNSTVDNRYGIKANIETVRGIEAAKGAFERVDQFMPNNPFLGAMFNQGGDDSTYSPVIDDMLYGLTINGVPLKERNFTAADYQRRGQMSAGWSEWFNNVEYIEADAEKRGIKPGTKQYNAVYRPWKDAVAEAIGKQYPLWMSREERITLGKSDKYVAIAQYLTTNEQYMNTVGKNNPMITALTEYLQMRNEMVQFVDQWKQSQGRVTTPDWIFDVKNRALESWLKQRPEFQQMYDRYFKDDELNQISIDTLVGAQ